MSKESIIEKIKKLLDRTEANGCTPAEAATAAAQVAMLLAKHGLTLSEINAEEMALVKEEFVKDTKAASPYQSEIAGNLETHFGVKVFIRTKFNTNGTKYHVLCVYGEKIKVEAFKQTYEFIYKAFKSCWTAYHKTLEITMNEKNLMRMSYLHGFIEGVTNEIIKEENANALVVVKSQDVIDFEQTLKGVHHFHTATVNNAVANQQGYRDGAFSQKHRKSVILD